MSKVDEYMSKRAALGSPVSVGGPAEAAPLPGAPAAPMTRGDHDKYLIQQFQKTKDPEVFEQLLERFGGTVAMAKRRLTGAGRVVPSTLDHELWGHLRAAVESYDPTRNTSPNTHITNYLPRAIRHVRKVQNGARIPEDVITMLRPMQQAREVLTDQLGRQPTHEEVAQHMNQQGVLYGTGKRKKPLTPQMVAQFTAYDRPDILDSSFEGQVAEAQTQRHQEILPLIHAKLLRDETPAGQLLAKAFSRAYSVGEYEGQQPPRQGEIAKELGVSDSKLSKMFVKVKKLMDDNK